MGVRDNPPSALNLSGDLELNAITSQMSRSFAFPEGDSPRSTGLLYAYLGLVTFLEADACQG